MLEIRRLVRYGVDVEVARSGNTGGSEVVPAVLVELGEVPRRVQHLDLREPRREPQGGDDGIVATRRHRCEARRRGLRSGSSEERPATHRDPSPRAAWRALPHSKQHRSPSCLQDYPRFHRKGRAGPGQPACRRWTRCGEEWERELMRGMASCRARGLGIETRGARSRQKQKGGGGGEMNSSLVYLVCPRTWRLTRTRLRSSR